MLGRVTVGSSWMLSYESPVQVREPCGWWGSRGARSQLCVSPSLNMKSEMLAGRQHCKSQQAVQMDPGFLFAESPKPRTVDTLSCCCSVAPLTSGRQ